MKDLYHPQPEPYETLLIRRDGAIDWLTLNRPERTNALTPAMYERLADRLSTADADADVRVVVVTGAGDAFTAGCCLDFIPIQHNTSHAHCLSSIGVSHSISLAWLQYSC